MVYVENWYKSVKKREDKQIHNVYDWIALLVCWRVSLNTRK